MSMSVDAPPEKIDLSSIETSRVAPPTFGRDDKQFTDRPRWTEKFLSDTSEKPDVSTFRRS